MKRKLFTILCILSNISICFAQDTNTKPIQFGLKAGVNFAAFQVDNYARFEDKYLLPVNYTGKLGFYAGIFATIPIAEALHFQPELVYSYRTMEADYIYGLSNTLEASPTIYKNNYEITQQLITLPLLITYTMAPKLHLEAGPQFGYVIANQQDFKSGDASVNFVEEDDNVELAGIIGLSYDISKKIAVGARFGYGFVERNSGFSNTYQLGIHYKL